MNDEKWSDEHLRALDPENEWRPNVGAALAGLQRRDRRRRGRQRGWIWSMATLAAAFAVVTVALPTPAKCAFIGVGCPHPSAMQILPMPAAAGSNYQATYKESGSPKAPVTLEIYSDYQCPHCAVFYITVFPRFVEEYVKTGKVRVVHRDFPLSQHPFARLAARYANAAGETGYYDKVVNQLFESQPEWGENGNVDAAVARVLPPEAMLKVRSLVKSDPKLDATVADDLSIVAREGINQTPTLVFIYKGTWRKVAGYPSFDLLRTYLEELLQIR